MGVNGSELTLTYIEGLKGMRVYAIERSYHKHGRYKSNMKAVLYIIKTTMHTFENLNIVLKRTPAEADRRRRQRLGDNISSPGNSPGKLNNVSKCRLLTLLPRMVNIC